MIKVNSIIRHPDNTEREMSLMQYLRNRLGLKSVKNGCGEGHCGACTVVIDGKAVFSCRKKVADLDNAEITTLEALSDGDSIHPLIYAFAALGAIQCGFCTPGFIMAAKALLDREPDPSEPMIRKALTGNICRCTGYVKIIAAVREGARLLREGRHWIPRSEVNSDAAARIGESVIRPDAVAKGEGSVLYADDLDLPGMLQTRVLRSERLHARIHGIDITRALEVPGVVTIVRAEDIPGENSFGPIKKDQQVLVDRKVRYKGDALAAIYAETEEAAATAAALISVRYEDLPPITSLDDALRTGAPELHPGSGNIIARMEAGRGDINSGFQSAHIIVEEELNTQYVEHGYLEPESCVAVPSGEDRLIVYVASQGPPMDAEEIAPVLGLPVENIRISGTTMGGGFGGKEDISVQIIASLGAFLTGRPVKYTFSRRESLAVSGKRNAVKMTYKTGFDSEGRITAIQADLCAKGGAYASVEEAVILRSVSFAAGPYTIPAGEVNARAVYLNHPPACAMRGFGNPTVTFGAETVMNMAAEKLGLDPFEIRLRNGLVSGFPTLTGDRLTTSVGVKPCLEAVRRELESMTMPEPQPGWKIGIGVAASYKNVGLGIGMNDSAGAEVEVMPDGKLLLKVGCVDMGQGALSAMVQILSARLGWPYSRIEVLAADTERDPPAGMTTASRQTFVSGNAVLKAAEILEEKIREFLSAEMNRDCSGAVLRDGVFVSETDGEEIASFDEFSRMIGGSGTTLKVYTENRAPDTSFALKEPEEGWENPVDGRLHVAYCFAAQATILEVHPESGRIRVLEVIIASDTGRTVNPAAVEGQMEGGVMMGLGYALSEEYVQDGEKGATDTYGKLGILRIGKTPRIRTIIVEDPHDQGPYGAKGMGELPLSMGAPSVVHAVNDALGVWVTSLPVTPGKVLAALKKSRCDS